MSMTDVSYTYKPVAKRATLYTDLTLTHATHGVAVRLATGQVYFRADTTGLWTELFDTDRPRILLHGTYALLTEVTAALVAA